MQLINTIYGVKQDLLQECRRIAEAFIQDGYKLYAKFDKEGDLIL